MSEVILAGYKNGKGNLGAHLNLQVVDVLPEPQVAEEDIIYLLEKTDTSDQDKYEEYIFVKKSNSLERLGGNGIDISDAQIQLVDKNFTYNGVMQCPEIQSVRFNGKDLIEGKDYVYLYKSETDVGTYTAQIVGVLNYTGVGKASWDIKQAQGSIDLEYESVVLNSSRIIPATIIGDGIISFSNTTKFSCERVSEGIKITRISDGTETVTIMLADGKNYKGTTVELTVTTITSTEGAYGVMYTGTADSRLFRIDAAALFEDPVPSINNSPGSSPFDNIEPWSKMEKSTQNGNTIVSIPKFYYKFTNLDNGAFKLEISNEKLNGFYTSPAHADRKDGTGERDTVYISRYFCDDSYKSISGKEPVSPVEGMPIFRTKIKAQGTGWYLLDYPMLVTLQMLYLVEYANFDIKQLTHGDGQNIRKTGGTDSMVYHTGILNAASQYRWIEGLWASDKTNWIEGILFNNNNMYVSMDIKNYGDSISNYTQIGNIPSEEGLIKKINFSTATNFEWCWYPVEIQPNEYGIDYSTYFCSLSDITNTNKYYRYFSQSYEPGIMGTHGYDSNTNSHGFANSCGRSIYMP